MKDKKFIGSDLLEAFSNGPRGFISGKIGSFKLNRPALEDYVDKVAHKAGINSIAFLSQSPWESLKPETLLCPFVFNGGLYDLSKINPEWEAIMEEFMMVALAIEPNNLYLRGHLFDNCQYHHYAPNPYKWEVKPKQFKIMNIQGDRYYFDVDWDITLKYIDAVMKIFSKVGEKYPGKMQIKIGNELTARNQDPISYKIPSGKYAGKTIPILPDALYVFRIAEYLVKHWGIKKSDMGWGATHGLNNIKSNGRKWEIIEANKSLQTHINRIAERIDPAWNDVHREIHGLGGWDGSQISQDGRIFMGWFSDMNSGEGDGSTDGASAIDKKTGKVSPWASKVDLLKDSKGRIIYCRFNAEATGKNFDAILAKCGKKNPWLAVLPQNLKDDAYMENAVALGRSYEKRYGIPPWSLGKKRPDPVPDPVPDPQPDPVPDGNSFSKWEIFWGNNKKVILAGIGIIGLVILAAIIL